MRLFLKVLAVVFLAVTVITLYPVIREWNFQFDAHGRHVLPDGSVYWESQSETKFFQFLLSVVLLSLTSFFAFRRTKA